MRASKIEEQFLGASASLLAWMREPEITDVMVNGIESLFLERNGKLESAPSPFRTHQDLSDWIERLLLPIGKRIDASRPFVDGVLLDGSRFHLILPPLSLVGPVISIRKSRGIELAALESFGHPDAVALVKTAFETRRGLLIAGGTGAGKTTLLSRLLDGVSPIERIVLIEETPEVRSEHPHMIRLVARAPNPDGAGEVTLRALIRNALRMRPDRLVLGECRGEEVWDLVQALNTGHGGSACTLHANSPRDALRRVEALLLMACPGTPISAAREWVAGAIGWVVHLRRTETGREIHGILKVQGLEGEQYRVLPCWGDAFSGNGF